jgi:hypothetical protein
MYYYESGTNTAKTTYVDVNERTANTNPVILTGDGRLPNVFFTGSAKLILTDADDVQYWERDPVTSTESSSFGDPWDSVTIYDKNDVVSIDSILYVSIINTNQNNNPASAPTAWTQFDLIKRWNTNETYKTRDPVIGTDGQMYTSLSNSNQGNDPVGDGGINWNPIGGGSAAGVFADWDASISYGIGGNSVITGSDGNYYQSILGSNLNNNPVSSPTFWTRVNFTKIWNTNETYKIQDLVTGSDYRVYQAVISNSAEDPTGDDGTNWLPRHNVFDNLNLSGNTISSTDTNGDIDLAPDGTGEATYNGDKIAINDDVVTNTDAITALEDIVFPWDVARTYNKPDIVIGSDDNRYITLIDSNTGNDPISGAVNWSRQALPTLYNANQTYDTDDSAMGSDGSTYKSLGDGNIGNDPVTDGGANWTRGLAGVGVKGISVFTASGTYAKPALLKYVEVTVVAGGGGGGGSTGGEAAGGGAGGGAAILLIDESALSANTTVTILTTGGAGGAAGSNAGVTGGSVSFGGHCSATGGAGGNSSAGADDGSLGGIGTGGDIDIRGGYGGGSNVNSGFGMGTGGTSIMGGGAPTLDNSAGVDGGQYGSGGSGANENFAGGDGFDGIVIVKECF